MLSKYKHKTACTWTNRQLEAAMEDVRAGRAGVRGAARKYGIPRSSLHDHLIDKSTKRYGGPPTVLTKEIEKEIATTCTVLQDFGFPLTKELVGVVIRDLLKDTGQQNPFTGGTPGRDWWERFLSRWPLLSLRKPQHLPKARALGATPAVRNYESITKMKVYTACHNKHNYEHNCRSLTAGLSDYRGCWKKLASQTGQTYQAVCGTAMRQASLQQLLHEWCWLVGGLRQYKRLEEVVGGSTSQFLAVVQLMALAYHPTPFTKGKTCTLGGHPGVHLGLSMG